MIKPLRHFTPFLLTVLFTMNSPAATPVPNSLLHSLFDPGTAPQPFAHQGWSVAVDGGIAVTGLPGDDVGGTDSGRVKVYDVKTGTLLHTLARPAPRQGDEFGSAVAISGARVVVGVPFADRAYVYDLAGATPTLPVATLASPSSAFNQGFGVSVAISGPQVVVGAYRNWDGVSHGGAAYVYDMASAIPTVPVISLTNPSTVYDAGFGYAVATSGTRVLVGAYQDYHGTNYGGSAYLYELAGATPSIPAITLTNPSPSTSDWFGAAVAMYGTRLVIGAPTVYTLAIVGGSVFVYELSSATPTMPLITLTNPSAAYDDRFGSAVAISGERVLVGAYQDDTAKYNGGSAYAYDLASASPSVPVVTLTNSSPTAGVWFGFSVALCGTQLVVGAPYDDTGAPGAGSAYVYDFASAASAIPTATLGQPSLSVQDYFGGTVAISGTRVVVGASRDSSGAYVAGSAYVYDLVSPIPTLPTTILTNPSPADYDNFGGAIAISGTRVVVGAAGDDTGDTDAGIAYVFDLASAAPTVLVATLTNPTPERYEYFGNAVAISGTRVVVAASHDNTGGNSEGSVYVYDLASATPTVAVTTLTNPVPIEGRGLFGSTVAISATRVVVGEPQDSTVATYAGSAYVFDLASATPTRPVVTLNDPRAMAYDGFGGTVAISGTRVVVGAIVEGKAYVYDMASATPTLPVATLKNPSAEANDLFGYSVAISGTRIVVGARNVRGGATNVAIAYVYELSSGAPTVPVATLVNPNPTSTSWFGTSVAVDGTTVVAGMPEDDTNGLDRGAAFIFGFAPPRLKIDPAEAGSAVVTWTPTNSPGFVLQYAETLAATNWFNLSSGAGNPVTIFTTNSSRIYRLSQP